MNDTLLALLKSKRFLTIAASVAASLVVTLGNDRLGLHLTQEQVFNSIIAIMTGAGLLVGADTARPIGPTTSVKRTRT